jgi:hypothetical protein
MATDFKTLQAMTTTQQRPADDYCPECGRPWIDPSSERSQRATFFPWRAALFGVLGFLLAITFGHRTVGLIEAESYACATITRQTQMCLAPSGGPACCAPANLGPGGWTALRASVGQSAMAEREIRRDLLATAGGVAIVLVGIGALLRPRLRARSSRGMSLVLAAWPVGESLGVVVCLLILALYADLVIIRLSHGWPAAWWEALDAITDQVSGLFYVITGLS